MLEKQPFLLFIYFFDQSNNTGAIDVKLDGFALEEKSSFKMLRLSFFFQV